MHSSIVLSAALLATGAVAAPIGYGIGSDQDISTRDVFAQASNYGITDEPSTHERRQSAHPIAGNAMNAARVGKNRVQHQAEQQLKAPAQSNYRPPKFENTPQGQAMKAPKPAQQAQAPPRKNPLEGWHKSTRDVAPENQEDTEDLQRRQTHPIVDNAMNAARVGKNRVQHQAKQQYKAQQEQSGYRAPKFENTPQGQAMKAPKPAQPAQAPRKNPLEGWHKSTRDVSTEDTTQDTEELGGRSVAPEDS